MESCPSQELSTNDSRQIITVSVHLCVQHYKRDAACRTNFTAADGVGAVECVLSMYVMPVDENAPSG